MPDHGGAKREDAAGGAARRRLAERRKALGLTQEALADLMGVERTTIVRWERGASAPLPPIRPKLARALQVPAGRLEELLTPSAPADPDPPGTAAGNRPRQLPPTVAGFTGRSAELAALTKMLAGAAGTVVISAIGGTAGVGKSALAIQWAHRAADRFPDGQLYVNLRGYDPDRPVPPADALAGFLRALGVPGPDIPPEEHERGARYRSLLAGRRVLVVLDNARSSDQARPLLPGSPACAVVVTSRDSLAGLVARDGAVRLDLDLLPLSVAMRLLRDLIGARAAADPDATRALAERCCRLPLALRIAAELAADRPGQSLPALVTELAGQQERLDLLDAGGDPHTAVRAVFSWSYRHLDGDTARAFRLAGLHPGADFDAYAVAALAGTTLGPARRMLDGLARAHLVHLAEPDRYGIHDLLRAYARELADTSDSGEEQHAALTRLLDHYLHTASMAMNTLYPAEPYRRPRIPPPDTPAPPVTQPTTAQAWLDFERATLVDMTVHATGHGWPGHATRLSDTLFRYLYTGGHPPEALTMHSHARIAAERAGDRAAEAIALNYLGTVHIQQSRYREAADHLRQALALFEHASDHIGQARALNNLGATSYYQGRYQEAIGLYRQALDIFGETGDPVNMSRTLLNLGDSEERQGRYALADRHYRRALAISAEIGARDPECISLIALGTVGLRQGRYRQAARYLGRALSLSREIGYRDKEATALARIGELRVRQGRQSEAARYLRDALALYRKIGKPSGERDALNCLGEVLIAADRPEHARAEYAAALGLASQAGDKYEEARAHRGLGDACRADGDADAASRHWQQALALFAELGTPEAGQVRAQLGAAQDGRHPEQGTSR